MHTEWRDHTSIFDEVGIGPGCQRLRQVNWPDVAACTQRLKIQILRTAWSL